jgi:hypothetical protein
MRHRSTRFLIVPVPVMGNNNGWARRHPVPPYPRRSQAAPPMPPQPIPSPDVQRALQEARELIAERKAAELLRWLDERKRA